MKSRQDVPPRSVRDRRGGVGPGEWLLLALPVLSGMRLRLQGASADSVVSADTLVDMAGPGLALLAIAVGAGARFALPRECRTDPKVLLRASTIRAVALFAAAAIGLSIVFPLDLITPGGPWRRMIFWSLGVALPTWSGGLYALVRGRSTFIALVAAFGLGSVPTLVAIGIGMAYMASAGALVMPAIGAGLVAGGGAAVAAWFGVTAPGWRVLAALSLASTAPAWAVSKHQADAPVETLDVDGLVAFDPVRRRATLRVSRLDTFTRRLAEVSLVDGSTELLLPVEATLTYAAGTRVTARRSRWQHATERKAPRAFCRETAPGNRTVECLPDVFPAQGWVILEHHPREKLVLGSTPDRIIVWDLTTGETSRFIEHDKAIRWPCFQRGRAVLFRLQQAVGPFTQHSIDLDTGVTSLLDEDHNRQCAPDVQVEPYARFLRGRLRLDKASRVVAPGLPEGGVTLRGNVRIAKWSADGATLALLFDGEDGNLGAYSEAWGLMPRVTLKGPPDIALSEDGSLLAYLGTDPGDPDAPPTTQVIALPSGEHVDSTRADTHQIWWDQDKILFIRDRRLIRRDPRTGREEVLFPPAAPPQ